MSLRYKILMVLIFAISFLSVCKNNGTDPLTPAERQWLAAYGRKITMYAGRSFPPVEFTNEKGEYVGISADFVRLIEKRLGFSFRMSSEYNFNEVAVALKQRKIDVKNNFKKTPERAAYLNFTSPYLSVRDVIIVRKEIHDNLTIDELRGRKVAVARSYATYWLLRERYNYLHMISAPDSSAALRMVSFHEADAAIVGLPLTSYLIRKEGITNLRVAGYVGEKIQACFASRNDWPILHQILEKGLAQITPEERQAIYDKWIHLDQDRFYISHRIFYGLIACAGMILLIVLFILVWNRTLKEQVLQRTLSLNQELAERRRVEDALRKSEERLSLALEGANDGIWDYHPQTNEVYYSPRWFTMLGYEADEFPHTFDTWLTLLHPEDKPRVVNKLVHFTENKDISYQTEFRMQTKDNIWRWIYSRGKAIEWDSRGNITRMTGTHADITDRKNAETQLRKSENLLNRMLSAVPDMISIHDREFNICYSNWKDFGNVSQEKRIIGSKCYTTYRGYDDICPDCKVKKAFETGAPCREQMNIRDGQWIDLSALPLSDENGETEMVVEFIKDISDIKAAEEELRCREAELSSIFRVAPAGIGLIRNRVLRRVNERMCQMLAYSNDELVGQKTKILYPSKQAYENVRKIKYEQFREYGTGFVETHWKRKDGLIIDVMLNSTPINPSEMSEGVIFTAMDITERKLAENELRGLRNLLKNTINSMPSVLVGVDAEGRVTQWNREAERMTGVSPDKAWARLLSDVFPQLSWEMDKVRKTIRDREVHKDLKIHNEVNGTTRFWDVTIFPLIGTEAEGAVIRVDDVTDRVRMEEMMIQTEKMLSVGGLAAGMAHEINNPLAGILQNAQVAMSRILSDIPANHRAAEACDTTMKAITGFMEKRGIIRMLEAIRTSGDQAAQIVENMLSFSRKSESRVTYQDIGKLLDKTVQLAENDYDLKKKYDFRKIEISRQYDPHLSEVPCEAIKIQQVFLNLLRNAAQAMTDGHTDAPQITLRTLLNGNTAQIELEDNGPGMCESVRKRIFEPFFTTKDIGKGTGLGLSVSYFIITENHGGSMFAESAPGKGSRFVIRMPLERNTS